MTIPYDFFSPVDITDWTASGNPFVAEPALMTWLDFKNNILNYYASKAAFIAAATDNGAYKQIYANLPDVWEIVLLYKGNSFNFPSGIYGDSVDNPPYVHPPSPQAAYSGQYVSVSKTDISYSNQEFSICDFMGLTSPFPWGWESNSGGLPPVSYFSGFNFDDSLIATFNDCVLRPKADTILPKVSGISYGSSFSVCLGSRVSDLQGLADWIFGAMPISTFPIFSMDYPPVNPGSTDILIPQHTIPPLKRRIPFQNYTQSIPRMIKK